MPFIVSGLPRGGALGQQPLHRCSDHRLPRACRVRLDERSTLKLLPRLPRPHLQRADGAARGGTMRLGAQSSDVRHGTLAHRIYGDVVTERHRHRYEANERYLQQLQDAGLVISAITQREKLTEIVELPPAVHPWYVGVQFHPEFKSTPWDGHPLFTAYVAAALRGRQLELAEAA